MLAISQSLNPLDSTLGFQLRGRSNTKTSLQPSIPVGFPPRLSGELTWEGQDFDTFPERYTHHLSDVDIYAIDEAIKQFKATKLPRGFLSAQTFPLPPTLVTRLRKINDAVYNGKGFAVIRGLDLEQYTEEEIVLLYAGITSHIASHRGNTLDHIVEASELRTSEKQLELLGAEKNGPMMFHTDNDAGSMLSLLLHTLGKSGGKQHLVSGWRVYNMLAEFFPEVLETLTMDFVWVRPNPSDDGKTSISLHRPIIGHINGQVQFNFGPVFTSSPEHLTSKQRVALDTLHAVCRSSSFELTQQAGDMIFINNVALLHARDAYVDPLLGEGPKRRVLCLMLHDEMTSWLLSKDLKYHLGGMFDCPPENQLLFTAEEWSATPREVRYRVSKYSEKHG